MLYLCRHQVWSTDRIDIWHQLNKLEKNKPQSVWDKELCCSSLRKDNYIKIISLKLKAWKKPEFIYFVLHCICNQCHRRIHGTTFQKIEDFANTMMILLQESHFSEPLPPIQIHPSISLMPIRPKTLLSFTSLFPLFTKNNLLRPCFLKGRYGGPQYHNVCATAMNGSCKPPAYLATHRVSGTHIRPRCALLRNTNLSEYMYTL